MFVAKHKRNSVEESCRFSWITKELKQDTKKKLETCKDGKKRKIDHEGSYKRYQKVKKEDNN